MNISRCHKLRVLVCEALDLATESSKVLGRPPVTQVALRVELATSIIEAVGNLVRNNGCDGAIIHCIIHHGVKKSGLQYARRKMDGVERRVVVSIGSSGGHGPLFPFHGLADLAEFAP